jgi:hypothetical protein
MGQPLQVPHLLRSHPLAPAAAAVLEHWSAAVLHLRLLLGVLRQVQRSAAVLAAAAAQVACSCGGLQIACAGPWAQVLMRQVWVVSPLEQVPEVLAAGLAVQAQMLC